VAPSSVTVTVPVPFPFPSGVSFWLLPPACGPGPPSWAGGEPFPWLESESSSSLAQAPGPPPGSAARFFVAFVFTDPDRLRALRPARRRDRRHAHRRRHRTTDTASD